MAKCARSIKIILTGKTGAGKSTLWNVLLETGTVKTPSPLPDTDRFEDDIITQNGIEIHVIDTPGLKGKNEDEKELKMCSTYANGKADLLIFCISVGTGHKFHDGNPEIIRCLTKVFGKQIWEHCIVAFTMSNLALSDFKEDYLEDPEKAAEEYRRLLKEYADLFQGELQALGVTREVKTVLELEQMANTIIAVPAGKRERDKVLPGLKCKLSDRCDGTNWVSVMVEAMQASISPGGAKLMQESGTNFSVLLDIMMAATGLVGAAGIAIGGAGLGAVAGAFVLAGATIGVTAAAGPIGLVATFGPFGPAIGAKIGAIAGLLGGAVGGRATGVVGGKMIHAGVDSIVQGVQDRHKQQIEREVEDRQKRSQKKRADRTQEARGQSSNNN